MIDETTRILIVDDSKMFLQVLVQRLAQVIPGHVIMAGSLAETSALIDENDFDLAMLDLNLPDAAHGEVVDLVLGRGVPVIVFAGDCSDQTRRRLWAKNIVDYVVKEGEESLRYAVGQAKRVLMNRDVKALVVEDSDMVRRMIADLLRVHRFLVYEACNGREGLQVMESNPDIKLIITDYEMPEMDGVQFIRKVRSKHPKEDVAIIGVSSHEQEFLSTRFLKSGANDFLNKPFSSEEFYCRISQNMELLDYIKTVKDYSERDYLTGLFNRRYLFDISPSILHGARERGVTIFLAMLDIDYFKNVNDKFGHAAGDAVLKHFAARLMQRFGSSGTVARLGGEEFCLLLESGQEDVVRSLDEFRTQTACEPVAAESGQISYTVSIGLCASGARNVTEMLIKADELLYLAKSNGRNRMEVCVHDEAERGVHV